MYICALVLLFCFLAEDVWCRRVHVRSDGKIVGGYDTTIEDFPYQVFILTRRGKKHFECGGSILDEENILTAAHCLNNVDDVTVQAGSSKANSGGTRISSQNYTQHPSYKKGSNDYDIGLIRLSTPLTLDGKKKKRTTLVAKDTEVPAGEDITVSGWGDTTENGNSSKTLKAVQIPIVSQEKCYKAYKQIITSRMFCAGAPNGGKDSCQGDSGGPVVFTSTQEQVGVVSFGVGCGRKKYPGVYANLANAELRDWITENTGI